MDQQPPPLPACTSLTSRSSHRALRLVHFTLTLFSQMPHLRLHEPAVGVTEQLEIVVVVDDLNTYEEGALSHTRDRNSGCCDDIAKRKLGLKALIRSITFVRLKNSHRYQFILAHLIVSRIDAMARFTDVRPDLRVHDLRTYKKEFGIPANLRARGEPWHRRRANVHKVFGEGYLRPRWIGEASVDDKVGPVCLVRHVLPRIRILEGAIEPLHSCKRH